MKHEERLELFEDYKLRAFKLACRMAPDHMTHTDAKAHALRALWKMTGETNGYVINGNILRARIGMEFTLDQESLSSWEKRRAKSRKGETEELRHEHMSPHFDKRDAGFELIPDDLSSKLKHIFRMRVEGFNFREIAETIGSTRSAVQMRFSRIVKDAYPNKCLDA